MKSHFRILFLECTQNSISETKENVKVAYCCLTNFPKFNCLNQQILLNSQVLWVRNLGHTLAGCFSFQISYEVPPKPLVKAVVVILNLGFD